MSAFRPSRFLDEVEARVLGCLLEKELSTPDGYPLSLTALTAAVNQRSNRDPVLKLAAEEVPDRRLLFKPWSRGLCVGRLEVSELPDPAGWTGFEHPVVEGEEERVVGIRGFRA